MEVGFLTVDARRPRRTSLRPILLDRLEQINDWNCFSASTKGSSM